MNGPRPADRRLAHGPVRHGDGGHHLRCPPPWARTPDQPSIRRRSRFLTKVTSAWLSIWQERARPGRVSRFPRVKMAAGRFPCNSAKYLFSSHLNSGPYLVRRLLWLVVVTARIPRQYIFGPVRPHPQRRCSFICRTFWEGNQSMATATKSKKKTAIQLQPLGDRVVVEREESEAKTQRRHRASRYGPGQALAWASCQRW